MFWTDLKYFWYTSIYKDSNNGYFCKRRNFDILTSHSINHYTVTYNTVTYNVSTSFCVFYVSSIDVYVFFLLSFLVLACVYTFHTHTRAFLGRVYTYTYTLCNLVIPYTYTCILAIHVYDIRVDFW